MTAESGRIPNDATEIDAAWLEAAFAPRFPGIAVSSVEILHRSEVTNAHARLRIGYSNLGDSTVSGKRPPELLFAKMLPSEPNHRRAILQTHMGLREARFYADLAPRLALRVPDVFAARYEEASGEFLLLMEDLDDSGCSISDGTQTVSPDAAAGALADLAALHVRFEDPVRRRAEASWVPRPDPPSDYGVVRLKQGLTHHRDKLSEAFCEMSELYIERQQALHAIWHSDSGSAPPSVIHGDTHIGNLFFEADGRVGFLDWGLVVVSTPLRDLSYFLCMALSVEDRRAHERTLIRHYLEARRAIGGVPIDFDEAWKTHRLQAAYLAPACCQIVTFPDDATPRRRRFAAAFLARAEAAIEDLESRAAVRTFAGF